MKKSTGWLGLLAVLFLPASEAANREIRALFQPDPSQPNRNVFVNKTPNSGYCTLDPRQCTENNIFSIELPIRFAPTPIAAGESVPLKVPANWRQLTVINSETQEAETVEVRIIGIGSKFVLSHSAAELVGVDDPLEGHQKLWVENSWVYAPSPCRYSGVGWYGAEFYRFFWKAPVEAPCIKTAAYPIPGMSFENVDFAYELRTPNPLGMSSGLYTGSMTYTIGPGMDFDFGPRMQPNDSVLNLDFVLDVQHTLKVDLPPGGNKVALEPEGGWQQWIDSGRKPARIFRDQMFYISASSRFKMILQCQNAVEHQRCRLNGPSGAYADIETFITLPDGLTDSNGAPLRRYPLTHNIWSREIQPRWYVDRRSGFLHFQIYDVNGLLSRGGAGTYSGNLTIIWDSEV